MPKDTFFNLPEEKRQKILDVAIDEFGLNSFHSSSINRIIEASGISKGSFYQYFENKKDLYKYIIRLSVQKKIKNLSPQLMNPDKHDFYTLIREMYESGLRFAKENPRLVSVRNKLLAEKGQPIYNEILNESMGDSHTIFEQMIEKAVLRGEVRQDIDKKMIAYLISSMNIQIVDYFRENYGNDWDDKLMMIVKQFINFIKYGIGTNKKEDQNNG